MSRTFAIGDVHGCAVELKTLLNKLPLEKDSTLIFIGDYIDRGPASREVVNTILTLRDFCQVVALRGNHEDLFEGFRLDPASHDAGMFIYNGGGATLASYADQSGRFTFPEAHLQFFDSLAPFFETPEYFCVHAGVPDLPLESLGASHHKEMLWVRQSFLKSRFRWSKKVVHGHTVVKNVEFHETRTAIDTGCVYRGTLSALDLSSHEIYSVKRSDVAQVHLRDFSSNRIGVRYKGTVPVYVHQGPHRLEFETIDYNEFGMLMRDVGNQPGRTLIVGEQVFGFIGSQDDTMVRFTGTVLREQAQDEGRAFAVKIDELVREP